MLLSSNEPYKIEISYRLIIDLLYKIDMFNEEIVYNYFEFVFIG